MNVEHRYCADLDMFAIDRPINTIRDDGGKVIAKGSCVWKTEPCSECFNLKFMRMYKRDIDGKDVRNERSWQGLTGKALRVTLDRKRKQTDRVRLMTRGEPFRDPSDIIRARDLLTENPDRLF